MNTFCSILHKSFVENRGKEQSVKGKEKGAKGKGKSKGKAKGKRGLIKEKKGSPVASRDAHKGRKGK
jgi:hypothetical protein